MTYPNNEKELITIFDNKDIKIIYATHNDDENGSGKTWFAVFRDKKKTLTNVQQLCNNTDATSPLWASIDDNVLVL